MSLVSSLFDCAQYPLLRDLRTTAATAEPNRPLPPSFSLIPLQYQSTRVSASLSIPLPERRGVIAVVPCSGFSPTGGFPPQKSSLLYYRVREPAVVKRFCRRGYEYVYNSHCYLHFYKNIRTIIICHGYTIIKISKTNNFMEEDSSTHLRFDYPWCELYSTRGVYLTFLKSNKIVYIKLGIN